MAGTILPPKEAAKSRPDNNNILTASGRALAIHTTLVMRLGLAIKSKGIRAYECRLRFII